MESTRNHIKKMTESQCSPYRKMIAMTVSIIAKEAGFDSVDKDALGTLTEMMQACKKPSLVQKKCLL